MDQEAKSQTFDQPCSITSRKQHSSQLNIDLPTEHNSTSAPSWPTVHTAAAIEQHGNAIRAYSPRAYLRKLRNTRDASVPSVRKSRQQAANAGSSQHYVSTSWTDRATFMPEGPRSLPRTSISSLSSIRSFQTSEQRSRRSSQSTLLSMTDPFNMMELKSTSSNCSDLFPLFGPDMDGSSVSSDTERYSSSNAVVGCGGVGVMSSSVSTASVGPDHAFPDSSFLVDGGVAAVNNEYDHTQRLDQVDYIPDLLEMRCTSSRQDVSCISPSPLPSSLSWMPFSSAENRGSELPCKLIENHEQSNIAQNTVSVRTTRSYAQLPSTLTLDFRSNSDCSSTPKKLISKAPYIRPQHPRLYCHLCLTYPLGFRGDHELRRHMERAHSQRRKVWICVQPTTPSVENWLPAKPLAICKYCKQQKQYNVYYNAAAHLRRAHFCPRKRGRKARGEVRESRAGRTDANWPPIEWLRVNGWLLQIEVDASLQQQPDYGVEGRDFEMEADDACTIESEAHSFLADADMLPVPVETAFQAVNPDQQPYGTSFTASLGYDFQTPVGTDSNGLAMAGRYQPSHPLDQHVDAPLMERTISAPATFSIHNPGGLRIGYGGRQYL
nr:hypothetical protein CFP56_09984 [Quercus suber]